MRWGRVSGGGGLDGACCFTSFSLFAARCASRVLATHARTTTPIMAAALAAAGLPMGGTEIDLADEEVDAALLAAGIRSGGGLGFDVPAHTQATAGSAAPAPPPAPAPPLARALASVLPPPAAPLPHSFSLDRPVQFDASALARARERKGPLLLAMMAEHARRGVR